MHVQPGQRVVTYFSTSVGGVDVSVAGSAQVYRNEIATVVPVTLTEGEVGQYSVAFDVPGDWIGYDQIHVRFELVYLGEVLSCTKYAGTVSDAYVESSIDRILDLLEADETYDKVSGKARKLLRGTNTVLLEKDVVGSTCVDSVSIAE